MTPCTFFNFEYTMQASVDAVKAAMAKGWDELVAGHRLTYTNVLLEKNLNLTDPDTDDDDDA